MDLFEQQTGSAHQPLAYRMRPRTLDEYIGQDHIIGHGRLLRRAIQADQLSSIILYGPPGTGKTTLARVIANTTRSHFSTLNAVLSGVKELRYEIDEAKSRLALHGKRTILFVDEVHRWNKSQQDALLPWVENGTFILIGATTENPYFEVNSALVSRSRIFQLVPLGTEQLMLIARQALADRERGYGRWSVVFETGALEHLVDIANGDARSLLNALELAVETSGQTFPPLEGSTIHISKEAAEESIQRKVVLYDKEGDYHFDIISAFIKSIRGSDPDAALYWMARMVSAGEDPKFIFRRMLISACEDVGMADPHAIGVVESDASAFERIGLPEGRFHLTHAALYLATAPKSNTTMGFFDALKAVEDEQKSDVPNHLKDGSRDKQGFGHGEGYLYPHAYHDHWVPQQYLPASLQGKVFYHPTAIGHEGNIRENVLKRRESQLESVVPDTTVENLTFSPNDRGRDRWVQRTIGERGTMLSALRDRVFEMVHIKRHDRILVMQAGHGMFAWEAFRKAPEGLVVAQSAVPEHVQHMQHYASTLDPLERPRIIQAEPEQALDQLEQDLLFEVIIGRDLFTKLDATASLRGRLKTRMAREGRLVLAQTIPSEGSRLSICIEDKALKELLMAAERSIYSPNGSAVSSWGHDDLVSALEDAGYTVETERFEGTENRMITSGDITRWIEKSYLPVWQEQGIEVQSQDIADRLESLLANRQIAWHQSIALVLAT